MHGYSRNMVVSPPNQALQLARLRLAAERRRQTATILGVLSHMPSFRTVARSATLGLAAGVLVLGIGGRALMRVIAVTTGASPGFSVGGSLEVVAAGALYGTAGGALLPYVPVRFGPWRAVFHAGALFVVTALTSDAARGAASAIGFPGRILALLAFGALLLAYSVVLVQLVRRQVARGEQAAV
jgi:hypothetical protein